MATYKLAANFIKCRKFEQTTNDNMKLLAISYILCYKYVMFCSNGVRFKLAIMIQNIITYNYLIHATFTRLYNKQLI